MRVVHLFANVAATLAFVTTPELPAGVTTLPTIGDDGYWNSKGDACAVCMHSATSSCAMYATCTCYATNVAAFKQAGTLKKTSK